MEGEERLTVRLSSEDVLLLNELVGKRVYENCTEAVREAVKRLLDDSFTPEEKAEILVKAESRRSLEPNDFTSDGADAEDILKNVITRRDTDE